MSHRQKLEQVLDLLINEEQQKAEELLHEIMVEKARAAYQSLVEQDEEHLGGDLKADFADDIEADHDDIDAEEFGDDEFVDLDDAEHEDHDDDDDEEVEDRVEDLEAALADLRAEFDALIGDEADAEADLDLDQDMDAEADMDMDLDLDLEDEEVMEATKLQHEVGAVSNAEGELAGTGKNSKKGATGKEAPYTRAPSRTETKGKVVDFAGGDEKGSSAPDAKDHTPASNVKVAHKASAQKPKEKEAGDAGTHSPVASRKK